MTEEEIQKIVKENNTLKHIVDMQRDQIDILQHTVETATAIIKQNQATIQLLSKGAK